MTRVSTQKSTKTIQKPQLQALISSTGVGLVLAIFSLIMTCLILEVGFRNTLTQQQYELLPHFGISEELQMRLAQAKWQKQRDKYGTTTYPSTFDIPDPLLGWKLRANADVRHVKPTVYDVSIQTNEFGLRGVYPITLTKTKGKLRIGVFGDSQTFGEPVNNHETYISILNQKLKDVEFLNFGVRGYGTDQMLLYFEKEADNYNFDIVVLAFAFYHIRRNATSFLFHPKPYFTLIDNGDLQLNGTPVPSPEQLQATDIIKKTWWLADKSVLLRWIWQRIRNLNERRLYSETGKGWRLTKALIMRLVQQAKEKGVTVVLMNIDDSHPELEHALQNLANQLDVTLLNLGPVLREHVSTGIEYTLPKDNHWNSTGHSIVANELRSHMCFQKILPHCDTDTRHE